MPQTEEYIDIVFDVDDEFSEFLKESSGNQIKVLHSLEDLFDASSCPVSIKDIVSATGAKELITTNRMNTFNAPCAIQVQFGEYEKSKLIFTYNSLSIPPEFRKQDYSALEPKENHIVSLRGIMLDQ